MIKINEIIISTNDLNEMSVFIDNNNLGVIGEKIKKIINPINIDEKRKQKLTNLEKKEILVLITNMINDREKKRFLNFNGTIPRKMKLTEINNLNELVKIRKFKKNLIDYKIL